MTVVTLDGVRKVFADGDSDVVALADLSLSVEDGELLVVVGPSGCGKTTLLRLIAGLECPSGGEIRIDGAPIDDVPPQDRDVAMVFQSYALYPHMTARENLAFGLEESTMVEPDEIHERVAETAAMLDIEAVLDRRPLELSGGQRQRVALGRAIVRRPAVFLLDEPLANLDANLRARMRTELKRLQADLGVTTVYVTHDQREAMTMGDRIAVLADGRLQQVGTPMACYHRPANRFVADFIGEPGMNLLEGTRSDPTAETVRFASGALEYPLPDAALAELGDATTLDLGVRPADVALLEQTAPGGPTEFAATVDVVEPLGDSSIATLSFDGVPSEEGVDDGPAEGDGDDSSADGDGDDVSTADGDGDGLPAAVGGDDVSTAERDQHSLVASVEGGRRVEVGDDVVVRIPAEAIHCFDGETGAALYHGVAAEGASDGR